MNQRLLLHCVCLSASVLLQAADAVAIDDYSYIVAESGPGRFPVASEGKVPPILLSSDDFPGVHRVAGHLQADIERVTGVEPKVVVGEEPGAKEIILVSTIGKCPLLAHLIEEKKIDVSEIEGRWETFLIQTVEDPMPGVDRALVIAGSDKRGTIYGMYDLSAQIGVSPWYWWADVPVPQRSELYVLPGRHSRGEPKVKYRGIFINDEAPALAGWAHEKFGAFNHEFYDKVFELILRLRGNYLWPAMWGRAIYDDDPESPKLADEYGIVIGMSHHEPMMRSHVEWERYGTGPWNYEKNEPKLREFWAEGIRRMGANESIVTIGMRGDGDEPMSEEANIELLERIVADQRKILGEVTGKDPATIPQIWALYKEVQEYYDRGMRVPDDVTLLLCDDNWGNIRKLPRPDAEPRAGGYGIYYHFDYVGDPRNYKWVNTNQISRVWEQMHLAYRHGVDRIWIVNVGDIKPMEFPTEFFLDYAWNPDAWPAERLPEYTRLWAAEQFGSEHATAIAEILTKYTQYNSRRKPELLAPETYSLTNYREAERIVSEYNLLAVEAQRINEALPAEYRDAYFQLVLHPVEACANLNELYFTVAKNRLYADERRPETNALAERARELYARDAELSRYYNEDLAGGKWSHMADQTHIGYTYWQQPDENSMPEVVEIDEAEINVKNIPPEYASKVAIPDSAIGAEGSGFVERDGYVSIEAEHFSRAIAEPPIRWQRIPDLGRTLSGITPFPVTAEIQTPGGDSPRLEYRMQLTSRGEVKVHVYVSPTLDYYNSGGLRYAVSFDDQPPQTVNIHSDDSSQAWQRWVADNINITESTHNIEAPGEHVLKFWMIDPGIVLQKIVVDTGGLKPSYLGPPESHRAAE